MTTTALDTTEDLLRAARENVEFREAFRREILTEELLELPQRFAEYSSATDRKIEALTERVDALTITVDSLVKGIAEYKEATNQRLDSIARDISSLHGMYAQQHDDYHRFRGAYAESAARKDDGIIAGKIARARGNRVLMSERLDHKALSAIFVDAVQRDLLDDIDDESQERFQNCDVALLVTERGRAQTQFYLVIEASHTAHENDLTRSANHAKVIERVKGITTYAIVASARVSSGMPLNLLEYDALTFVRDKNPDAALWHQLRTSEMEPMVPSQ